jgi:hypothetical protein
VGGGEAALHDCGACGDRFGRTAHRQCRAGNTNAHRDSGRVARQAFGTSTRKGMADTDEMERPDVAECGECSGTGNVRTIQGDGELLSRCISCAGTGRQLSRDEWLAVEDLRLVDEPADTPSFANHAEEVAWHLSQFRRAS